MAGIVAYKVAGNIDLSISAARRGYDMACQHGGRADWLCPVVLGGKLTLLTARGRASRVLIAGIDESGPSVRLSSEDTLPAEMLGFLHLAAAQCAARGKRHDDAQTHLAEAGEIAARIGERRPPRPNPDP